MKWVLVGSAVFGVELSSSESIRDILTETKQITTSSSNDKFAALSRHPLLAVAILTISAFECKYYGTKDRVKFPWPTIIHAYRCSQVDSMNRVIIAEHVFCFFFRIEAKVK